MLIRRLGFLESCFAELHDKGVGAAQVVGVSELHGPVDSQVARRALETLYRRHPLFRVSLMRKDDAWWFVSAGSFDDVPVTIRASTEVTEWQLVLERELDHPVVQSTSPLWRVTLLVDDRRSVSTLLLTLHHAITDGLSTTVLSRQFVEAYNRIVQGLAPDIEELPLRSPVEWLLANAERAERDAAAAGSWQLPEAAQWRFEASAPPAQRRSRVLCRNLPTDPDALFERCLTEGTTPNDAIIGALVVASQSLPTHDAIVPCIIPTDVRRRARPPISPEENGIFFWNVVLTFDAEVAHLDSWERARRVRAQYRERFFPSLAVSSYFSASDAAAAIGPSLDPNRAVFEQAFAVSYWGRHRTRSTDTPLHLVSVQGAASPRSGGPAIIVTAIVLDERMSFLFTWADPLLSEASAERFADTFVESLRRSLGY